MFRFIFIIFIHFFVLNSVFAEEKVVPDDCYVIETDPLEHKYYETESGRWAGGYNLFLQLNYRIEQLRTFDWLSITLNTFKVYTDNSRELIDSESLLMENGDSDAEVSEKADQETVAKREAFLAKQREANKSHRQVLKEAAEKGDPDAIAKWEAFLAKEREANKSRRQALREAAEKGNADAIAKREVLLAKDREAKNARNAALREAAAERDADAIAKRENQLAKQREAMKVNYESLKKAAAEGDPDAIATRENQLAKQREANKSHRQVLKEAAEKGSPDAIAKWEVRLAKEREAAKAHRQALREAAAEGDPDAIAKREAERIRQLEYKRRVRAEKKGKEKASVSASAGASQELIDEIRKKGASVLGYSLARIVASACQLGEVNDWTRDHLIEMIQDTAAYFQVEAPFEEIEELLSERSEVFQKPLKKQRRKGLNVSTPKEAEPEVENSLLKEEDDAKKVIDRLKVLQQSLVTPTQRKIEQAAKDVGLMSGWDEPRINSAFIETTTLLNKFGISTFFTK